MKNSKSTLVLFCIFVYSILLNAQQQNVPEIFIETGHVGDYSIYKDVTFSHNGTLLASSGGSSDIIIWDVATGKELRKFAGHTGSISKGVSELLFLNDDRSIISAGKDGAVHRWDIASGIMSMTYVKEGKGIQQLDLSRDGRMLLALTNEYIRIWDVQSGRVIRTLSKSVLDANRMMSNARFTYDGTAVVASNYTGYNVVISLRSENITPGPYEIGIWAKLFGFPQDREALIGESKDVVMLNMSDGTKRKIRMSLSPQKISGSGKFLIGRDILKRRNISIFSLEAQKEIVSDSLPYEWTTAAVSPIQELFAVADGNNGLKIYDFSGRLLNDLVSHSMIPRRLAISRDHQYLSFDHPLFPSVPGKDELVRTIFSLSNGTFMKEYNENERHQEIMELFKKNSEKEYLRGKALMDERDYFKAATPVELTFDPGTKKFYRIKSDIYSSTVTILEADPAHPEQAVIPDLSRTDLWRVIRSFTHHTAAVEALTISLQKRLILTGSEDKTINLVEFPSGRLIRTYRGHTGYINSLLFNNDCSRFFSSSADGTIRLWDTQSGEQLAMLAYFNDGEWIIITPQGYFSASSNGASHLNVRLGMKVYSMENFFETYYRPEIVKTILAGGSVDDAVLAEGITKGIRTPPAVTLSVKDLREEFVPWKIGEEKNIRIVNGTVEIRIAAANTGGGIHSVKLFNNGKAVGEEQRGFKQTKTREVIEQIFTVSLTEGNNILKAVGVSDDLSESNPVTVQIRYTPAAAIAPRAFVFGIGINQYRNKRYDLNYCVGDVNGFAEQLTPKMKRLFSGVTTKILTDREANRANVLAALEAIKNSARPEDVFLFFYAGHGIALDVTDANGRTRSEFFYVLSDVTQMTDVQKVSQDGLSGTEVKKILTEIRAAKQVLLVDACNSGAFAEQFAVRGAAEENALAKLSRASGSVIFASTTKEQFAKEFKELQHGAFTYVLINALNGGASLPNGQITVAGLKSYIDDAIPEVTKKFKGEEQFPTSFIWGQDFPIGLHDMKK